MFLMWYIFFIFLETKYVKFYFLSIKTKILLQASDGQNLKVEPYVAQQATIISLQKVGRRKFFAIEIKYMVDFYGLVIIVFGSSFQNFAHRCCYKLLAYMTVRIFTIDCIKLFHLQSTNFPNCRHVWRTNEHL